jgi:PAS domain S-box-containing protein
MKADRKTKAEKGPPAAKAVKSGGRVASQTNGKPLLAAYEHIPVGLVETSLDGKYMDVNEEFCRILAYSRQELLGLGIKDCTHEEDYGIDNKLHEQLIASKIPFYKLEKRFVRKNGETIWVELTRTLVCNEKGKPLYALGVVLDISDRKNVEKVLRESVERLRLATEAAQMFMWEWDFESQIYTLADNFEQVLGFSAGLLPKNSFETVWALSPPQDVQRISEEFQKAVEDQSDFHPLPYRLVNPENSQVVWLEINAKIVYDSQGNPLRMFGVAQNITETKEAETALELARRQAEQSADRTARLQKVTAALSEAITPAQVAEVIVQQGAPAFEAVSSSVMLLSEDAQTLEIMYSTSAESITLPYRRFPISLRVPVADAARSGQPVWIESRQQYLERYPHLADQINQWGQQAAIAIPMAYKGRILGVLTLSFDRVLAHTLEDEYYALTLARQGAQALERARAENALRESEERFRAIVSQVTAGIAESDLDSRLVFVNPRFCQMLGYSEEEMLGRTLWELTYKDDLEENKRLFKRMITQGESYQFEKRFLRKDGSTLWTNVSVSTIRDLDGNAKGGVGVVIDIEERKRAEEALTEFARQQEALYKLSEQLHRTDSLADICDAALDAISGGLQCERASVLLFDDQDVMRFVAWRGLSDSYRKATEGHSPWKIDAKDPEPICMDDVRTAELDESLREVVLKEGIGSLAFIPLVSNGKLIGKFMIYFNAPHIFSDGEVDLSLTIAHQLAFGIDRKRAGQQLRESEERYRFIVENTSDGIWWIQLIEPMPISLPEEEQIDWYYKNAVIRQCNLGMARMYGYDSIEEVVGLPMRVVMPRENPVNFELSRQFIHSRYRLVDAESREVARDGRELVFLNNMVGIVEDGYLKGEWGTNRDITERKRAEDALRRNEQMFSTLVDAAPFGVYFIDSEFRLRATNKGSQAVFSGIDPLIGRDFAEILRIIWQEPFATEAIERFRHTLRTGESFISPPIIEPRANIDEIQAYDWQIHRITLADGTFGAVCYFYDLSEQKQMEATVRASESLYRAIARNIPGGGVYVVDKDFRYLVAEGPVTEAFGLTREMLEGHTVLEAFPGERGERMEGRLKQNFAGEIVRFETEHNGRIYWTQQAPLLDSIGQAIILTIDITERKRAEEALRQSEERFVRFMQHLPGLAWIKDMDGRYVYANAAAEKAFNTPQEKLYGLTDEEIFPAGVAAQFRKNDGQALTDEKGVQVIETLEHADGVLHSSLVSKFPIPGPDGSTILIGGTAFDITERLGAEEALRDSEERFRAILRQATAGIVRKDVDGRFIFVNQAFCNMLGYTEAELLGKTVWDFMHEEDVAESKWLYHRLMREGVPFNLERRLLREDGSVIWVDASVSPIMDATGKPQSVVTVEVDITRRKKAEEALQQMNIQLEERVQSRTAKLRDVNQTLRQEIAERQRVEEALRQSEATARENEKKLSTLFELLPVGISFLDLEGQIIQMNPALTNILKLSKRQSADQGYRSRTYIRSNGTLMPPAEFASHRALAEGRTIYNVETGVLLENSEVIWTSVSAAPVDVAEVGAAVVTVDITERKHAEHALQESRERLQILSQRLVEVQEEERRAIARELHDRVGQTLAALNINLIIISGQLAGKVDEQVSGRLSDSMKLVAETISLVRDVMSNLRPSVLDDYGLQAALESYLSQFVARYEIQAKLEKPDHPIARLGASIEMTFLRIAQEALMNVARHANASQVSLSLRRKKNAVHMTVQDNGTGIESWQDANRPGSHGLTIMRERAEAFGGNLRVSSIPGKGTRIEVSIPVENDDSPQTQKEMH